MTRRAPGRGGGAHLAGVERDIHRARVRGGTAVRGRIHCRRRRRIRAVRRRVRSQAARHAQVKSSILRASEAPPIPRAGATLEEMHGQASQDGQCPEAGAATAIGLRRGAGTLALGGAGGARGHAEPEEPLGHRGEAALHVRELARELGGRPLHGGTGLPGSAADDTRHLPDHAPRPHLDAAPADRAWRAGGLQRAAESHPGAWRDGRVADPLQLGLSRL